LELNPKYKLFLKCSCHFFAYLKHFHTYTVSYEIIYSYYIGGKCCVSIKHNCSLLVEKSYTSVVYMLVIVTYVILFAGNHYEVLTVTSITFCVHPSTIFCACCECVTHGCGVFHRFSSARLLPRVSSCFVALRLVPQESPVSVFSLIKLL